MCHWTPLEDTLFDSILYSYVKSYQLLRRRFDRKWPRKLKGEMSWYFRRVLLTSVCAPQTSTRSSIIDWRRSN